MLVKLALLLVKLQGQDLGKVTCVTVGLLGWRLGLPIGLLLFLVFLFLALWGLLWFFCLVFGWGLWLLLYVLFGLSLLFVLFLLVFLLFLGGLFLLYFRCGGFLRLILVVIL